jgi:hypothetical protein
MTYLQTECSCRRAEEEAKIQRRSSACSLCPPCRRPGVSVGLVGEMLLIRFIHLVDLIRCEKVR